VGVAARLHEDCVFARSQVEHRDFIGLESSADGSDRKEDCLGSG
jgi:hypothetical protein